MFDKISPRYDLLNRLLSFRQDVAWRKKLLTLIPDGKISVLDLATGTGDVILTISRSRQNISKAVGLDMARQMLTIGAEKAHKENLTNIQFVPGDAQKIPFHNKVFDIATMSFGIRNVPNVPQCLREIHRITKENGRVLILEFSLPNNRLLKTLYLFYFRHVLPKIGGIISGNYKAYSYLNRTVEDFPYEEAFCKLLYNAGFKNAVAHPVTFGVATIYVADK